MVKVDDKIDHCLHNVEQESTSNDDDDDDEHVHDDTLLATQESLAMLEKIVSMRVSCQHNNRVPQSGPRRNISWQNLSQGTASSLPVTEEEDSASFLEKVVASRIQHHRDNNNLQNDDDDHNYYCDDHNYRYYYDDNQNKPNKQENAAKRERYNVVVNSEEEVLQADRPTLAGNQHLPSPSLPGAFRVGNSADDDDDDDDSEEMTCEAEVQPVHTPAAGNEEVNLQVDLGNDNDNNITTNHDHSNSKMSPELSFRGFAVVFVGLVAIVSVILLTGNGWNNVPLNQTNDDDGPIVEDNSCPCYNTSFLEELVLSGRVVHCLEGNAVFGRLGPMGMGVGTCRGLNCASFDFYRPKGNGSINVMVCFLVENVNMQWIRSYSNTSTQRLDNSSQTDSCQRQLHTICYFG